MSSFSYAVAFNLTFLDVADSSLLKKMKLNPERCKEMPYERYRFEQKPLGDNTAMYVCPRNENGITIKQYNNVFLHDPSINALPLDNTLMIAARELKHYEERDVLYQPSSGSCMLPIGAAFIGAGIFQNIAAAIPMASIGYAVNGAMTNRKSYKREEAAYQFMVSMACVLGIPTRAPSEPVGSAKANPTFDEIYIEGCPNTETIEAIKQEARDRHITDNITTLNHKQLDFLHDETINNIIRHFDFV